ncbi:SDR family oxidoreductase [Falsiroseomonas oryzae]|uniref:SDR family oxidoreductase n=1 Tax=Falsiroseomonas oryzae TaxID=2766473 RepID=UPI0022EA2A92|nr:NADH-ubiquinone oxidoreductase [Roseomonas sp. MO-31]
MIAVIGAAGRSGAALCRALLAPPPPLAGEGRGGGAIDLPELPPFTPVVRDAAKWTATGLPGTPRLADLRDPAALREALRGATHVVNCAHARHAPAILAAAPADARFVFLGSTRRFSRWPDDHGDGVRAGDAAFLASGRAGVMLHPTMIYGAEGEDNVQRLAALLRRIPLAPLPGGGRALVQPIHQDDLTACILAALRRDWAGPQTIVVAGPRAMPYRDFLMAVARAAGLRPPAVLPIPGAVLMALAPLTRILPRIPTIRAAEVRRLLEDKAFDVGPMRERLGVVGRSLEDGLRLTFRAA